MKPYRQMMRGWAAVRHDAARRRPVVVAAAIVEGLVIIAAAAAARGRRPLGEPADLQRLRGLDEGGEHVLRHVGLALVHVLDQRLEVLVVDVGEDDDGLLVVGVRGAEDGLEFRNEVINRSPS